MLVSILFFFIFFFSTWFSISKFNVTSSFGDNIQRRDILIPFAADVKCEFWWWTNWIDSFRFVSFGSESAPRILARAWAYSYSRCCNDFIGIRGRISRFSSRRMVCGRLRILTIGWRVTSLLWPNWLTGAVSFVMEGDILNDTNYFHLKNKQKQIETILNEARLKLKIKRWKMSSAT